jgi:hypothetical protein
MHFSFFCRDRCFYLPVPLTFVSYVSFTFTFLVQLTFGFHVQLAFAFPVPLAFAFHVPVTFSCPDRPTFAFLVHSQKGESPGLIVLANTK